MFDKRTVYNKIQKRVLNFPIGTVFALCDFMDLADSNAASKALTRLCAAEVLHRVFRGIYWRPDGIHAEPDPDDVAHAIARGNSWKLVPEGDTVLHLNGLQENGSRTWTYATNGTTRQYQYGQTTIVFRHRIDDGMREMSPQTLTVVQILKAYGKGHVNTAVLAEIRATLGNLEDQQLLKDVHLVSKWMGEAICELCRMYNADKKKILEKVK